MRHHKLHVRRGWRLALLAITAAAFAVFFVSASSGNLTGSTFESTDGKLVKITGTDWCNTVVSNASASVHIGFEFNKNACDTVTHAGCSGNNVTPARSEGDILIVYDLEGGGNPSLSFRRWVLSGSCEISQDTAPCWGPKQSLNSTVADGSLDAGASGTTDPINPGAPRTIGQFRFGEAAINLTDSNILSGCAALGSVYTVSRSSGDSGTATMKDFIAPKKVNINKCGKIKVKKVNDPNTVEPYSHFSLHNW